MREKWNQIKKSNKTRKGRKSVKDKNGSEDKGKKYKIVIHMVDTNSATWINTLNVSGLNALNKRDYQS